MSAETKYNDFILKVDLGEPSEMAKRKALEELRETPENVENGIRELKKLLEDEQNLNIPWTKDEWFIKFLRCCKFYPESARDRVKVFFNLRRKYSEVTSILYPSKLKHVFEANLQCIMPQRDQHGRRILLSIAAGKNWDHNKIHFDHIFASSILCSDFIQLEPESQINGVVYVLDLQGLSFVQCLQYTPYRVKRFLDYLQDKTSVRVKCVHFVNQPKIFQPIFNAAKPFFSTKFSQRLVLHGSNFETLHKYISRECLPESYGGTLKCKPMYGRETYELMAPFEKEFENLREYGFKSV